VHHLTTQEYIPDADRAIVFETIKVTGDLVYEEHSVQIL